MSKEFPGLFMSGCDIQKMNWCQQHRGRCPGGRFPGGLISSVPACHRAVTSSESSSHRVAANVTSDSSASAAASLSTSVSSNSGGCSQGGDRDRCCQTCNEVVSIQGRVLDHRNITRNVVSLDDYNQFIHVGSCPQEASGSCAGDGECFQETKLVSLLCVEFTPAAHFAFRQFLVNSYCSCRSASA
ncbi:uncharacterized protein LOC143283196 [Babylonia areolata]|uniref:uncharacterized protein LOC143283196 n=1 Tax=Babylonia areolata TaxID=304850 RepID=UPI003FCF26F0